MLDWSLCCIAGALDCSNVMVGIATSFRDGERLCVCENEAAGFGDSGGTRTGTLGVGFAPWASKAVGGFPITLAPSEAPSTSAEEGRLDSIGRLGGGGIGGGNFGGGGDGLLALVSASRALSLMSSSGGSLALGTMSDRNSRSSEESAKALC